MLIISSFGYLNFFYNLARSVAKAFCIFILHVKKILLKIFWLCSIFLSFPCFADPFMAGDLVLGEKLHKESCSSCHDGMVPGGNGDELYLSEFRAINSSSKLKSQVEFCANQNGVAWFEDEIESVSRYLNNNFYKFLN
ncbi:MAG: hypothetical protein CBC01_07580 [Betaproteobacteria bacterium TMED41]|nr:MAG: hypothetical protein CBC01_07580 [Betaproteobacteria bacterium TMED41]